MITNLILPNRLEESNLCARGTFLNEFVISLDNRRSTVCILSEEDLLQI